MKERLRGWLNLFGVWCLCAVPFACVGAGFWADSQPVPRQYLVDGCVDLSRSRAIEYGNTGTWTEAKARRICEAEHPERRAP